LVGGKFFNSTVPIINILWWRRGVNANRRRGSNSTDRRGRGNSTDRRGRGGGSSAEYGGKFTYAISSDPTNLDPYFTSDSTMKLWMETIAQENWMGVDPEEWDFLTRFVPIRYFTGGLAESWDMPDQQTMILHIRKNVYWHNKSPMNGRELTAYDVEFSFHRLMGLGSGYTNPSPYVATTLYQPMESATATDKYTCVLKWSAPAVNAMRMCLDGTVYTTVVPPEAVKQFGDLQDWEHAVGTGPFILHDYVSGSSLTTIRNPNYWGYDEHYPENRLPYVDEVKALIIPDNSTRYAAIRTGKIDTVGTSWENMEQITKSNPELISLDYWSWCFSISFPMDRKPWSDIRVRQAMQMAIDLETIAKTHYGDYVDGTPVGAIGHQGYRSEYDDWPQDVKDTYAYNPEGAKALLAEAGYPDGLKCTLTTSSTHDLDLAQILQAYFKDIGVDMTIDVRERTVWNSLMRGGKCDLVTPQWAGYTIVPPMDQFPHYTSGHYDYAYRHVDDPVFAEMNANIRACTDEEEQRKMITEADMYYISQHWDINILPTVTFTLIQPWVKRYAKVSSVPIGQRLSRIWIDQDLKNTMIR
jgi:peptide/nickel transport system substrate-binding protein